MVILLIVAHHYVVNSGVWSEMEAEMFSWRSQFLLMFGMWGKTGINCFLVFYLFIPFLTILVNNLNQKMYGRLMILCLLTYTIIELIPDGYIKMNYVSWFGVLFVIGSYIRNNYCHYGIGI